MDILLFSDRLVVLNLMVIFFNDQIFLLAKTVFMETVIDNTALIHSCNIKNDSLTTNYRFTDHTGRRLEFHNENNACMLNSMNTRDLIDIP